jgi:hypothetical protein
MYYAAVRNAADVALTFVEMVKAGLTRNELEKLIARRPALWGRFSSWIPKLP